MVLVLPSSTCPDRVLIGSDRDDPIAARREVDTWLAENRHYVPRTARHLSVFEDGVFVREWVVAERPQEEESSGTPLANLGRLFHRAAAPSPLSRTAETALQPDRSV